MSSLLRLNLKDELTFFLEQRRRVFPFAGREASRLALLLPGAAAAECDVCGVAFVFDLELLSVVEFGCVSHRNNVR